MTRVTTLDIQAGPIAWTEVPMPGANLPFELVRLDSSPRSFGLLGQFPAGFVRREVGGYRCSEEFVVVAGMLEMEGDELGPGSLGHVPARFVRTSMSSVGGCLVWAWFSGLPSFQPPGDLGPSADGPIRTVDLRTSASHALLETPEAVWTRASGELPTDVAGDWLSGDLMRWKRGVSGWAAASAWGGDAVVRRELEAPTLEVG